MKRISYNSPVILTFSIISFAALVLGWITNGRSTTLLFSVYRYSLKNVLTYVRFFTHVLGHSGYEHFLGNIAMMLVVGPTLEEKYGSKPILFAMLITAFVSGVIHFALFPNSILLGASGIVYMLIIMSSVGSFKKGTIPLTLIFAALIYIGGQIVDGVILSDNVSQLTHIIGGVCGGAFAYFEVRNK